MARRTSNSNASRGCGIFILCGLIIYVLIIIVWLIKCFLRRVYAGIKVGFISLLIMVAIYAIVMVVFYFTHQKSLTYDQIVKLSRQRAKNYAKSKYAFKKVKITPNSELKSNLDVAGRWYSINEPLSTFPSLVAALLKGKHHEWVIIAIEKDGVVSKMWANKGYDNKSVTFNCDLYEVIKMCKQSNSYSILCFHNHPNSDPGHYTTLIASEQDRTSAKFCSNIACNAGINWFDFVCAQGDYIMYFSRISDEFEVAGSSVSNIVDHSGITPQMDYRLQKEYYHLGIQSHIIGLGVCLLVASLISFGAGRNSIEALSDISTPSAYIETSINEDLSTDNQVEVTTIICKFRFIGALIPT